MIKCLLTSTYNTLKDKEEQLNQLIEKNKELAERVESLTATANKLQEEVDKLTEASETTSVTIIIDEDIQKVTPLIKYNAAMVDKLIEQQYLDRNMTDKFSIELALFTVAEEAMSQILDAYQTPFEDI